MPLLPLSDALLEISDHFPADLLGMDVMKVLNFYVFHEMNGSQRTLTSVPHQETKKTCLMMKKLRSPLKN